MSASAAQILRCDPLSISFSGASGEPTISSDETRDALNAASDCLARGRTVVFPTETVYGLGARALDSAAARAIFSVKGRPPDNPLIVHVSSFDMLTTLLPHHHTIPPAYHVLMKHFWPGPLTLLFPRNPDIVPPIITANHPTVAVRMPSHPVARALIAIANAPLAAPSANTSGRPSPTRAEHVNSDLGTKVPLILDGGPCGVGLESTVVDGLHEDGNIRVLRPGGVTVEDIERVLKLERRAFDSLPQVLVHKRDFADQKIESAPTTPGMKYRHYSPSAPVTLLLTLPTSSQAQPAIPFSDFLGTLHPLPNHGTLKVGVLAATDSKLWDHLVKGAIEWFPHPLGPITEPSTIAHNLFDGLISLDKQGVHHILIEEVDEEREGLAIMNRVRKAASETVRIAV